MKEENGRGGNKSSISFIALLVFIALAIMSINACGYLGIFGEASWKEEVLLHDGSKIIVKRWQKLKGRHELGQKPPVGDQSIKFTLPGTNKTIKWKDEYSREIRSSNFELFALHILNNTSYIITSPRLCFSYNIWGRPNPPYVIFKYEGNTWKRIEIAELPQEFKNINIVINTEANEKKLVGQGLVTAERVKELNSSLTQAECKTIVRTPIQGVGCENLATDGKGKWVSMGLFTSQPSYESCLKECKRVIFDAKHCPCSRIFKNNTKGE